MTSDVSRHVADTTQNVAVWATKTTRRHPTQRVKCVSTKVVDETISRLRNDFEVVFEDGSGTMKVHRGKRHEFVGMSLDYEHKGEVHISMIRYVQDLVDTFKQAQLTLDDYCQC